MSNSEEETFGVAGNVGFTCSLFPDGQTGYLIQQQMYSAFSNFSHQILEDCQANPKIGSIPVAFQDPVFGRFESNYGTFIAPGVIVT